MDVGFHHRHAGFKIFRQGAEFNFINLDAGAFHRQQHWDQPAFDLFVKCQGFVDPQARVQGPPQPQRHIGVLGGIGGGAVERNFGEGQPPLAGAGDAVVRNRRVAKMQGRKFIHAMPVGAGILGEGYHHRVIERRGVRRAGAPEDQQVELGVLEDFQHRRVDQQGCEGGDGLIGGELLRDQRFQGRDMAHRNIAGAAGGDGERNPNQIGAQRVEPIGFGIHRDNAG